MFRGYIVNLGDNFLGGRMQTIRAGRLDTLPITRLKVVSLWKGGTVSVPLRISESEQCSLQTGYLPSLEVSAANYLSFLSGGGDTDKTLPFFCLLF